MGAKPKWRIKAIQHCRNRFAAEQGCFWLACLAMEIASVTSTRAEPERAVAAGSGELPNQEESAMGPEWERGRRSIGCHG